MFGRRNYGGQRTKTQPSHYSPLPFHTIRLASYVSSLVVSAIMFYFCYHLRHDHFKIPWTFLLLLAVSLFTLIILTITTTLHCCHVLSPKLNLFLNTPLLVLWLLGFSLLTWNMSGTLTHICNSANWGNSDGVMICRLYKALFSFSCIGLVASIAAVALDISTRKRQTRMGNYAMMGDKRDVSALKTPEIHLNGDVHMEPLRGQREAEGYAQSHPRGRRGRDESPYGSVDYGYAGQQLRANEFGSGYEAPAEQTRYDAGYHGR